MRPSFHIRHLDAKKLRIGPFQRPGLGLLPQVIQQKADTEVALLEVKRQVEERQATEDRSAKLKMQLESSRGVLDILSRQSEQQEATNRRLKAHVVKLRSQLAQERFRGLARMRQMQQSLWSVKAQLEHCKWRLSLSEEQVASEEAHTEFLRGELFSTEYKGFNLDKVRAHTDACFHHIMHKG